jgi:FkbM family methyltransferase
MEINYIDLGVHRGEEIDIVLRDAKDSQYVVNIYGVEADKDWVEQLKYRYEDFENIEIFNYAITDGLDDVKFYLEPKRLGSSIFQSKQNVTAEYQTIPGINISEFIKRHVKNFDSSFNVLKLNIEGAELMVYRDLIETNMLQDIDLFCGHPAHDIMKVPELSDDVSEYFSIIERNNIDIKYLCGEVHADKSINIFDYVR